MRLATLFAMIASIACALAISAPASAQSKDNLRKLSAAYKLIEDDEAAKAVEQLNALLDEVPEDAETASQALLLRGQAYTRAGRPAQALSDFNAALWLQGLNSAQRKDAVAGRKRALAKLGLADESETQTVETGNSGSSGGGSIPTSIPTSTDDDDPQPASEPRAEPQQTASAPSLTGSTSSAPATSAWQTDVQAAAPEPEQEDSGGIGSFFSDLFGGSDATEASRESQTQTAASGWTASTTEVSSNTSAAPSDAGAYRIQIASVGSRDGAESEVRRLSRKLGDAIDGETPTIVRTDTDSGNTYYRIMVGPKPSRSAAAAQCEDFKSRGVDCLVVTRR